MRNLLFVGTLLLSACGHGVNVPEGAISVDIPGSEPMFFKRELPRLNAAFAGLGSSETRAICLVLPASADVAVDGNIEVLSGRLTFTTMDGSFDFLPRKRVQVNDALGRRISGVLQGDFNVGIGVHFALASEPGKQLYACTFGSRNCLGDERGGSLTVSRWEGTKPSPSGETFRYTTWVSW
jgi:hypothetical protein